MQNNGRTGARSGDHTQNALHSARVGDPDTSSFADLPPQAQWVSYAVSAIGGLVDAILDDEHVPATPVPGWAASLQAFAAFLRDNPTGREMRRRRVEAKFIADLRGELPEEARDAGLTPTQMSDWLMEHSNEDVPLMPMLGLFREVMYEKLSDVRLRWEQNDLTDMMYLTTAAGYCDFVVGERAHIAHLANACRRLGRADHKLHRSLQSVVQQL